MGGLLKLEVKTKTDTGVEFTSGGSSNIDSGKVAGNLETKYKVKDLGMTLTEKWTTDNTLNTTLDVADKLLPGLKVTLDTSFAPSTGSKSGSPPSPRTTSGWATRPRTSCCTPV